MLILTSNEQANSLVKNGVLYVDDDIEIAFNGFHIDADINCRHICSKDKPRDIHAWDINAGDINAKGIKALNISAWDIDAWDINSEDIYAEDIHALNINAKDIHALDIDAWDINTGNIYARNINTGNIYASNIKAKLISYYAICCASHNITCTSIKGRKESSRHFCLNGELTIKQGELKC